MPQLSNNQIKTITATAICAVFLLLPQWNFTLYSLDEGSVLNGAWRIYNGQQLYQDFRSNFGPLTLNFYSWIFTWFGVSYAAAKIVSWLILGVSAASLFFVTYSITRRTQLAWFSVTLWSAALIFSSPLINHNSLSSYVFIIALAVFYYRIDQTSKNYFWDVLVGLLLAMVTLVLLTKGFAGAIILGLLYLLYLPKNNRKPVYTYCATYVMSLGFTTAYWGLGWITTPILIAEAYTSVVSYVSFIPLLTVAGATIFLSLFVYKQAGPQLKKHVIALLLTSSVLYASILNLPDKLHIFSVIFPFCILVVIGIDIMLRSFNQWQRVYIISMLSITLTLLWITFAAKLHDDIQASQLYITSTQELIKSESVLVYPFGEAHYFFLANTTPPDVSVPDFYAAKSPFREKNISSVYNNPPTYIIEQTDSLKRFNLDDPYHELKQNCYYLIKDDTPIEKIYKLKSGCSPTN